MSNKTEMRNRMPYNVPEGYLENLESRLSEIPSRKGKPGWWTLNRGIAGPAMALAASLLIMVVIGGGMFTKNETSIPVATGEEEIVEYLINTDTSVYLLSENL